MRSSKIKIFFVSLICFIVGFAVGVVGNIFVSLPDSYKIPSKVSSSSSVVSGTPDAGVISNSDLSIHFLELGNKYTGDCIYIKVGDTDILIDGGSKTSSVSTITSYVDEFMTDDVMDYIIITHAHEDHYAGYATNATTESLFDHYRNDGTNGKSIGTIITFAQTRKSDTANMHSNYLRELGEATTSGAEHFTALECSEETINYQGFQAQSMYDLGTDSDGNTIWLQILYTKFYTSQGKLETTTENNFSVCFQIIQGTKKYLFTGDLEKDGEESLVDDERNSGKLSSVELYKAGHHGSKTSSSAKLMAVIQPKIVVVCCVAGSSEYTTKNENQFPTQEFIDNVSIYTSRIYVTTLCIDYSSNQFESFNGNITICSTGSNDTIVMCSNNDTVLKDTDWFKANRTLPENAVAWWGSTLNFNCPKTYNNLRVLFNI